MTIKEFINKAIEGGWEETFEGQFNKRLAGRGKYFYVPVGSILLDVRAWEAVSRVEKWGKKICTMGAWERMSDGAKELSHLDAAKYFARKMMEALWDGKSIEDYFKNL